MNHIIKKKRSVGTEPQPCPFCGEKARIRRIGFKKYIVHCTSCAACTPSTWEYKNDAVVHWNSLKIDDLHLEDYCITGVSSVAFSEVTPLSKEESTSFSCQSVGISFPLHKYKEAVVEMGNQYMLCRECSMYGRIYHNKDICDQNTDIEFIGCEREYGYLKTITFKCGEKTVILSADSESKCILVREIYK